MPDIIVLTQDAIRDLSSDKEVVCTFTGGKTLIMSQTRYSTVYAAGEKGRDDGQMD